MTRGLIRKQDHDNGIRRIFCPREYGSYHRWPRCSRLSYLFGLSTSDLAPALEQFLGTGAGLSASAITRLTTQWRGEAKTFQNRDLSASEYVYLWVDGVDLKVRLEQEK